MPRHAWTSFRHGVLGGPGCTPVMLRVVCRRAVSVGASGALRAASPNPSSDPSPSSVDALRKEPLSFGDMLAQYHEGVLRENKRSVSSGPLLPLLARRAGEARGDGEPSLILVVFDHVEATGQRLEAWEVRTMVDSMTVRDVECIATLVSFVDRVLEGGHELSERQLISTLLHRVVAAARQSGQAPAASRLALRLAKYADENGVLLKEGTIVSIIQTCTLALDLGSYWKIPQRASFATEAPRAKGYYHAMRLAYLCRDHDAVQRLFDELVLSGHPDDTHVSMLLRSLPSGVDALGFVERICGKVTADMEVTVTQLVRRCQTLAEVDALLCHVPGASMHEVAHTHIISLALKDSNLSAAKKWYEKSCAVSGVPPEAALESILRYCEENAREVDDGAMQLAESCLDLVYDVFPVRVRTSGTRARGHLANCTNLVAAIYSRLGLDDEVKALTRKHAVLVDRPR